MVKKSGKRRVIGIVLVLILVIAALIASYISFFSVKTCTSLECFQKSLTQCSKVSYINDDKAATWQYKIEGDKQGYCNIEVTLLQAKEGDISLSKAEGESMTCRYIVGKVVYPEKDLGKCNGLLKENIQEIIIEKLHKYILQNLGSLDENLKGV
jgi:hypothetical protein